MGLLSLLHLGTNNAEIGFREAGCLEEDFQDLSIGAILAGCLKINFFNLYCILNTTGGLTWSIR